MNARAPFSFLALATSFAIAGCGGSDGLAKADLAKKADAICATAKADSLKLKQPTDFATNPSAAATYLEKVSALTHKESDDLAALTPADDVKADYDALVAAEKKLVTGLDGVVAKAKAKDASGLKDLSALDPKDFVAASNKIGAKGCAAG
jgi:hypothetical protein